MSWFPRRTVFQFRTQFGKRRLRIPYYFSIPHAFVLPTFSRLCLAPQVPEQGPGVQDRLPARRDRLPVARLKVRGNPPSKRGAAPRHDSWDILVSQTACFLRALFAQQRRPNFSSGIDFHCFCLIRLGRMLSMERAILSTLGFDLSAPTALKFLDYYKHVVRPSHI